jgi:hypothetical protein
MLASMMKVAGAFSKQAREPIRDTVAVKGDRMWHGNDMHGQVIDLGKETISTIDFQKKTWSVMTFAEMTQALDDMSKKMKQDQNADVHFKVSANATGQTRQIGGRGGEGNADEDGDGRHRSEVWPDRRYGDHDRYMAGAEGLRL